MFVQTEEPSGIQVMTHDKRIYSQKVGTPSCLWRIQNDVIRIRIPHFIKFIIMMLIRIRNIGT